MKYTLRMVIYEQNVQNKIVELIQYLQTSGYKTEQSAIEYGIKLFNNVEAHVGSIVTYRRSNNPKFYQGLPVYQVNGWCFPYKEDENGDKVVLDMVHYNRIKGGLMESIVISESLLRKIIRETIDRILPII